MAISSRLVAAVGEQRAAAMLFSGELVRGAQAAAIGLVLEAVPMEQLLERALALAHGIAACAPLAVRRIKKTLRLSSSLGLEAVLELEASAQAELSASRDAAEGIRAMLESREPSFEGR
jgi:enoyl-CoA hydratase